jgi:hypothetical protein
MTAHPSIRIGCGAGFSSDRLDPAVALARDGRLDALVFECLAERTLAFGHRDRRLDPERGYNPWLGRRLRGVLGHCREQGTRIVTNMGVANPEAAARETVRVAREMGLHGTRVAALTGDDVTGSITPDTLLWEGMRVKDVPQPLIAANAYLGCDALLPALEEDVDCVITGRVADPSLFLAVLCHRFGWRTDDWQAMGTGTMVGHLLECAGQVTGGYFADPGPKDVPDLAHLGFPLAEVDVDGDVVITKLPGSGGLVSQRTVKEQLLYEVHEPHAYLTPDVTADFSGVRLQDDGADRVRLSGARGRARPEQLKATVAFDGGLLAEAELSYAGLGAMQRARLAGDIVRERMASVHHVDTPLRIDLIGVNALHASAGVPESTTRDVRVRCALRTPDRELAELVLWEMESLLCCGPAAGGGYRGHITPSVITYSASVPRDRVTPQIEVLAA